MKNSFFLKKSALGFILSLGIALTSTAFAVPSDTNDMKGPRPTTSKSMVVVITPVVPTPVVTICTDKQQRENHGSCPK